jgi:hypothetical protein
VTSIPPTTAAALTGQRFNAYQELTAQRDLARDVAVALEQQVAQAAGYHREYSEYGTWPHQCATCGTTWPCRTWRALHPETARSSVTGEWELGDIDPEATP